MIILTIRTDKPESELGLYDDAERLGYVTWQAHRQLAETIHSTIDSLCNQHSVAATQIQGVVCYKGPGSFTGLRIGLSVGNSIAYALSVPIVATAGDSWNEDGIIKLLAGETKQIVVPEYDAPAITTKPRK